jgi:hypothetical protein
MAQRQAHKELAPALWTGAVNSLPFSERLCNCLSYLGGWLKVAHH